MRVRCSVVLRDATWATLVICVRQYLQGEAISAADGSFTAPIYLPTNYRDLQRNVVRSDCGEAGGGSVRYLRLAINDSGIVLWHARLPSWRFYLAVKAPKPLSSRNSRPSPTCHVAPRRFDSPPSMTNETYYTVGRYVHRSFISVNAMQCNWTFFRYGPKHNKRWNKNRGLQCGAQLDTNITYSGWIITFVNEMFHIILNTELINLNRKHRRF